MIARKWPVARAEHVCEETGLSWIAETRACTGTWVVCEAVSGDFGDLAIIGAMFPLDEGSSPDRLLVMSDEGRANLRMSVDVYTQLNAKLATSYAKKGLKQALSASQQRCAALEAQLDAERGRASSLRRRLR